MERKVVVGGKIKIRRKMVNGKNNDGLRMIISTLIIIIGVMLAWTANFSSITKLEDWKLILLAIFCVYTPTVYWYARATSYRG